MSDVHEAPTGRDMARPLNKVFGIGLSKTGTTSLARSLTMLGLRTADYPHDGTTLAQMERGDFALHILRDHDAITDTPAVPYYPQFDRHYPGSRFILTVREKEGWLRSAEQHWAFRDSWASQSPAFRRFSYFICAAVYGVIDFNRERFSDVYDRHLREVQAYFRDRPDDLLMMDICAGDGWEKLCPFLGLPEPAEPFPFLNRKEEKQERRQWVHDLEALHASLSTCVPAGARIVLVDEDQLADARVHETWRCLPLMERDGRYWGRPADSDAAIAELGRLRQQHNVGYLAVAWPARWWLEHYRGFADYLRQAPRLVENDQVTVFDLRSIAHDGSAASPAPARSGVAEQLEQALDLAPSIELRDLQDHVSTARWTLTAEALRVLAALVQVFRPRHILELGSGLSTRLLARTAVQMKHPLALSTIDHDPAYGDEAVAAAKEEGGDGIEVRGQIAPLVVRAFAGEPLPAYSIDRAALAAETAVDFALIDGPPAVLGGRGAALFQVMQFAQQGTIVLLDDADRAQEQQHLQQWQEWLGDAITIHRHPLLPARLALIEIHRAVAPDQLWTHRRHLAAAQIQHHLPPGSRLILAEAHQWEASQFGDYRLVPFVQQQGTDQGPPADDHQALSALDAVAADSAPAYLAIPWSSSWWFKTFPLLFRKLNEQHQCIHRGPHVTIYQIGGD